MPNGLNLLLLEDRLKLIKHIESSENKDRKQESFRQTQIFQDRLYQYVREALLREFSKQTVDEIPIIASINLARRIIKQEASIYRTAPNREFTELSDDQSEVVKNIKEEDVDGSL